VWACQHVEVGGHLLSGLDDGGCGKALCTHYQSEIVVWVGVCTGVVGWSQGFPSVRQGFQTVVHELHTSWHHGYSCIVHDPLYNIAEFCMEAGELGYFVYEAEQGGVVRCLGFRGVRGVGWVVYYQLLHPSTDSSNATSLCIERVYGSLPPIGV
jgi:hypothetical protein